MSKRYVYVDCGTENLRIYDSRNGLICDDPMYVLLSETGSIIASGKEAKEVFYKPPEGAYSVRPVKNGMIADHRLLYEMIFEQLKNNGINKSIFSKPEVVFSISPFLNSVGRRATMNLGLSLQFKKVHLIPSYVFFLFSKDVSPLSTEGNMLLDLGAGKIDICVTSFGRMIKGKNMKEGMGILDRKISKYIRESKGIDIGSSFESLFEDFEQNKSEITISGKDKVTGIPKKAGITQIETDSIYKEFTVTISDNCKFVLEEIAPDLSSDIVKNKLIIAGGGARSSVIKKHLQNNLKIDLSCSQNPGSESTDGFHVANGLDEKELLNLFSFFEA